MSHMKKKIVAKIILTLLILTTIFTAQAASPYTLKRAVNKHLALENPDRYDFLVMHLLRLLKTKQITVAQFADGKSLVISAIHNNQTALDDLYSELNAILKKAPRTILYQTTRLDADSKIDSVRTPRATGADSTH